MQTLKNTITAVVSSAVAFCPLASPRQKDEQTIREIEAAWSEALEGKDLDKVMSNYAKDASFLPPDEPIIHGRGNIREWFAKRVALPGYFATFAPTTVVVSKARDMAYELGTFRVTINDESGKPVVHLGKHLVTWQKRNGQWDPPAARTVLPYAYKRTELLLAGHSKREVIAAIKAAIDKKELPALEQGTVSDMMSKSSYLTDNGRPQCPPRNVLPNRQARRSANVRNAPIVSVNYWYLSAEAYPQLKSFPPMAVFLVMVHKWSDGTPAPSM